MTKTVRAIASRLAYEFITCAVNYEPHGARAIDDCASALDTDFPGVDDAYRAATETIRKEWL